VPERQITALRTCWRSAALSASELARMVSLIPRAMRPFLFMRRKPPERREFAQFRRREPYPEFGFEGRFARDSGVIRAILARKGHRTVIAAPDGSIENRGFLRFLGSVSKKRQKVSQGC
jgi:hypothetical protein